MAADDLEPLLLARSYFNHSMDKLSHANKMWHEITHPFPNFNGYTVEVWDG